MLCFVFYKTKTGARAFHSCLFGTICHCLSVSHFSCYLQQTSEDTFLWLSLSHLNTGTPDSPLIPWNCFIAFPIEHWFGCRATEPGFAGDIGYWAILLINWKVHISSYFSRDCESNQDSDRKCVHCTNKLDKISLCQIGFLSMLEHSLVPNVVEKKTLKQWS